MVAPCDEAVKLDSAKKPRAMDIVGTKGPNQGKTIPAIYEFTDTTLRVCYDLSGKARPKRNKLGLFYVQLCYEQEPDNQPLAAGIAARPNRHCRSVPGATERCALLRSPQARWPAQ